MKCPDCKSSMINPVDSMCNACGEDFNNNHMDLMAENKKLRDAFDLFINKTSDFMIRRGINPCEWASYRDAVKALEATK